MFVLGNPSGVVGGADDPEILANAMRHSAAMGG